MKLHCTVLFLSVKLGLVLAMLAMASALHVPVHGELHVWPHRNCRIPCRSR